MTKYNKCRLCLSEDIVNILDFGETALANSFLTNINDEEIFAPLTVFQCQTCGSVQLRDTVDPNILFKNYLYESSTSKAFRNHFREYAELIVKWLKPKSMLDIGSNDGLLLRYFQELGCSVLGVEPATNLANIANAMSTPTINKFFNKETAAEINRKFNVVTANNVFAHIDDLHEIIEGVKIVLEDDGVFIFENAYFLDTINNLYFDQVYSEHLFFHSIRPLIKLFNSHGMKIFDVTRNKIQGGSIRVYVCKSGVFKTAVRLNKLCMDEAPLYNLDTYKDFNNKLIVLKQELHEVLSKCRRVCAFGAPAKFTTFCKVMGLDKNTFSFVIDDAPLKQGKFTPGTHIPVVGRERLKESDVCVVTAWNFAKSIIENTPYDGTWIIPLPKVEVIT